MRFATCPAYKVAGQGVCQIARITIALNPICDGASFKPFEFIAKVRFIVSGTVSPTSEPHNRRSTEMKLMSDVCRLDGSSVEFIVCRGRSSCAPVLVEK